MLPARPITLRWSRTARRGRYRELDHAVTEIAAALQSLGIRAGDRMMIVSENCIALAGLLLAASRIDAWAIVVNPRLSPRELDQIRDHSGARRMFFTAGVSKEAAAHAHAMAPRSGRWTTEGRSASAR